MADWTTPTSANVGDIYTAAWYNTYTRDNTPIFYWKTTAKAVTTATETDLLNGEITLAANVMGSNRRLRFWAVGDLLTSAGTNPMPRFKLKIGSTVAIDTGVPNTQNSIDVNRSPWIIQAEIQQMNATNAQEISFVGWILNNAGQASFATGRGIYLPFNGSSGMTMYGQNNTAVDMTSAQTFALTVINGVGAATYETRLRAAKVAIGV